MTPDLHWTAGGYVWPVDQTLEFFVDDVARGPFPNSANPLRSHSQSPAYARGTTARGSYGGNPVTGAIQAQGDNVEGLLPRVKSSGALSFAEANMTLLTDFNNPNPIIGKERVYFVSNGELTKLVVNVLLVVFIP